MLEADRQPDVALGDAGGGLIGGRELLLGRRRGLDGEAGRGPNIGDMKLKRRFDCRRSR